MSAPAPSSFNATVLATRPAKFWRPAATMVDLIAGVAATYVGSPTGSSTGGGMFNESGGGNKLTLNGTSQYANIGQCGNLAVRRGKSWSMGFVYRTASTATGQCLCGGYGAVEAFIISTGLNRNNVVSTNQLAVTVTAGAGKTYWIDWITDGAERQVNRWNTLIVTYDVVNGISVYVNGTLLTPANASGTSIVLPQANPSAAFDQSLYIGARNAAGTADRFFNGDISAVMQWDRAISMHEARLIHWAQSGDSDQTFQYADTLLPIVAAAGTSRIAIDHAHGDSNAGRRTGEPTNADVTAGTADDDGWTGGHPTGCAFACSKHFGVIAARPMGVGSTGGGWDNGQDAMPVGVGDAIRIVADGALPTFVKNRVSRTAAAGMFPFTPCIMASGDVVANSAVGAGFIEFNGPDTKIDLNGTGGSVLHYCCYGTSAPGTDGWFHIRARLESGGVIGAEIAGVRIQTATVAGMTAPDVNEVSGNDFLIRGELVIPQQTMVPGDRIRIDMVNSGVEGAHGPGGLLWLSHASSTTARPYGASIGQYQAEGGRSLRYILQRLVSTSAGVLPAPDALAATTQTARAQYFKQLFRPVTQAGYSMRGFGVITQLGNDLADANYSLKQDGTGDSTKLSNAIDGLYQNLLTTLMWDWTALELAGGSRANFPFVLVYQANGSNLPEYRGLCLYAARLLAKDLAAGTVGGGGRLAIYNADTKAGALEEDALLNRWPSDTPHARRGTYIKTWDQFFSEAGRQAAALASDTNRRLLILPI